MLSVFAYSQEKTHNYWSKIEYSSKPENSLVFRKTTPNNFKTYHLNIEQFKQTVLKAPKRSSGQKSNLTVSFPNSDGKFQKFNIFEASVFAEELQEKHPNIRSFSGQGIDDPTSTIRFSISPKGVHGMILSAEKSAQFIDPYLNNTSDYIVYSKKDLPEIKGMQCLVEENAGNLVNKPTDISKIENANDGNLRTFRLALAATGEYSQFHLTGSEANDTERKASVLTAMNTTMTRVNGIYERDLSLTMIIVANNTNVIYLNGATDPFNNTNASILINQSQSVIDSQIGAANYDIGHTFSTGGGGLAQLNSPCTLSKARGITGSSSPIGDAYDVDYVAHEMGHQYGANHTFNGDAGSCAGGNRNDATAVEPGSGSTIMAYAGICSPQNVQLNSDAYFHIISIQEMWANISAGNSTCATIEDTLNDNVPTVDAGNDYIIPKSTPFVLTGVANDLDGDDITYCWEQTNTEITAVPLVSTATGGPAFRSFSPTTSEKRYFPQLSTLLNGSLSSNWEVIPSVSRTMNFALTVRDNNAAGGQTATDEMVVTVNDAGNPFEVTSQNTQDLIWTNGTNETITWEIGNTNIAPINCATVNILLSTDGGLTYPTVLAANTPNDGSEVIVVPNLPAPYCRVMVQPTNNIFFSINTTNFSIDYSLTTTCTTYTATPNMSITDASTSFDTDGLLVTGSSTISDVNVNVDITHTYISDLLIAVLSPDGTQVNLFENNCGSENNMNITFDDSGLVLTCAEPTVGTFAPNNPLNVLNGETGNGTWIIGVNDRESPDSGTLNSWSVEICTTTETPLTVEKYELANFSVYPNPTSKEITISLLSENIEDVLIQLYDSTGRLISKKEFQSSSLRFSQEVDFGNVSSGVYILNVKRGNQLSSKRLVVY